MKSFKEISKQDLLVAFKKIDEALIKKEHVPIAIVIIGAASILMLDIRDRGTSDIDLAQALDCHTFASVAKKLGYDVEIVSVTSTVDFSKGRRIEVFRGEKLTVFSVNEKDLIKLKLERFRKQDPVDIDFIIKKFGIDFSTYRGIVIEAVKDYVGNREIFSLSALSVADKHYASADVLKLEKELSP